MATHIERTFLGWDRPALDAAADALLARPGAGRHADLSGLICVLPGGRAKRMLLAALVAGAERAGVGLSPPLLLTPGEIASVALGVGGRPIGGVARLILWASAARETPAPELAAFLPAPPEVDDVGGWLGVAALLDGAHQALGAGGLRFADVPRLAASLPDFPDDERWRALAGVQARYERGVSRAGLVDDQIARINALANAGAGSNGARAPGEIVLIGVVELNAVARRALEAYAGGVRAMVFAPESLGARFDALGCVVPEAWRGADAGLADEQVCFADGPREQASAALGFVASLARDLPPGDVVVGVPDESVALSLQALAGLAEGVRVRSGAGLALVNASPVRLLRALAEHAEAPTFTTLGAIVRHPDAGPALLVGAGHEPGDMPRLARWVDALDRLSADLAARTLDERHFRPGGGDDARDQRPPESLLRAAEALCAPLSGKGERPASAWGRPIAEFMARVYAARRWDPRTPADRVVIGACEAIRAALDDLESLPEAHAPAMGAPDAVRLIARASGAGCAPDEPDEGAIEALGWLELALDPAPVAILTGMNEGFVPSSVVSDALLPDSLRRVLGLEHDATRLARDTCLLASIVASRPHVRAIAGRRGPDGDPLRPSRLLFACADDAVVRRVRRFADPAHDPWPAPSVELSLRHADADLTPVAPLGPERPRREGPASIRVTAFKDWLASPYLYYTRHELGLEERADDARELDPLAFGNLLHDALCAFAATDVRHATDAGRIREAAEDCLMRLARGRFGRSPSPAVALQIEWARHRIGAFGEWQARWRAAGWSIAETEWPASDHLADLHRRGLATLGEGDTATRLIGRIDRIDTNANGQFAILDYKTGERVSTPDKAHGGPGRWCDLQLPLYSLLAAERVGPTSVDAGSLRLGYIALGRSGVVREMLAPWSGHDVADALREAAHAAEEIRKGRRFADIGRRPPTEGVLGALAGTALIGRGAPGQAEDGDDEADGEEGGA